MPQMILPAIGFVIGVAVFGVIGLVLLARQERISPRNLAIFEVGALSGALIVGWICKTLALWVGQEPWQSGLGLLGALVMIAAGTSLGSKAVSVFERPHLGS